jgi:hypothetical protein
MTTNRSAFLRILLSAAGSVGAFLGLSCVEKGTVLGMIVQEGFTRVVPSPRKAVACGSGSFRYDQRSEGDADVVLG